jgi:hypothetical protein
LQICGAVQVVPHAPQLFGSKCAATQMPLQSMVFAPHESAQAPLLQTELAPHVEPHVPQFFGSSSGFTQTPLQLISGEVQVTVPESVLPVVPVSGVVPPESLPLPASVPGAPPSFVAGVDVVPEVPVADVVPELFEEEVVLPPSPLAVVPLEPELPVDPSGPLLSPPVVVVPLHATSVAVRHAVVNSTVVKRWESMGKPPGRGDARRSSLNILQNTRFQLKDNEAVTFQRRCALPERVSRPRQRRDVPIDRPAT